ncbi:hypothetical protein [Natronobiforma cellulositropha]|uniref:hypothetical protein n=1 Tax=Natronobiforma cellulositropha TaxID=1679076 RepID=UPI0021D59A88|nr:hypothetical protein [Natronobiforma cellulositropha]
MGPSAGREDGPPGREPGPATTRVRRSWYGHGTLARVEKGPVNCFLHDVSYTFADISILSLPALLVVMLTGGESIFGVVSATMVAWGTMTVVAAAIRGGWLSPFATDVPGWVSMTAALAGLRLLYYNATILTAAYGGVALALVLERPPLSLAVAALVAFVATMAFPRIAETVARG